MVATHTHIIQINTTNSNFWLLI